VEFKDASMRSPPPVANNEAERLARLQLLDILDTGPEPIFDALTRTASQICESPVALLSLVDADRQWFKSNVGLDGVEETPREIAFCAHAILQNDLFEVTDASQDDRFSDNPLVMSQPHIRFYAGAPVIMSGGHNIGTLCVIDQKPKTLTALQRETLTNLATVAAHALEMRIKALELDKFNNTLLRQAQALNAKEILYQAIVEDQTDLISLALPSGELTFVNEAYAAHFGQQAKDMVGHNLLDYVAPSDKDDVAQHLRTLCVAPGVATGENQMRPEGGESRWVAWSNRSIGDAQGKVIGLHSVGRDITDRKRMELALRDSHDNYRVLYESTPAMMHSIDQQGRLLFVSDKWLHTLGYTRDEVIGRPSIDFFTEESRAYAQQEIIPAFFKSGRCDDIAYRLVCKDGRIIDTLLSAVLVYETPQLPARSLAILVDVTEKNSMAKALRAKEERLAIATTANQIGIWELELATGRLEWNDTMFQIFGRDPATFQHALDDWSRTVHPDDLQKTEQAFEESLRTLAPLDIDFRVIRASGEIRVVNARAVFINDANGKPSRAMGTNHDVTERKAIEQALANSALQLRTIANNLPVLISHMDTGYRYTFTNDNYQAWYSFQEPIVGRTVEEAFGVEVFKKVEPHITAAMKGESVTFELISDVPDSPRHLLVHYVPDRDLEGNIHGVFGMVQDRTEQHLAREKLEDNERQLRAITNGLPVLIAYIDTHERVQFMNATAKDWAGVEPEEAKGKALRDVLGDTLYEQRKPHLDRALLGERVEFALESEFRGVQKFVQSTFIPDIRSSGEVRGVFALSSDVTALKTAEKELQRLVLMDTLTGLPNRRYFEQRLAEAMARNVRTGNLMALMFLDVDYFKSINDTFGHGAGDTVLTEFAQRLKSIVRANDFAARLAGDEFVIILEDLSEAKECERVAEKILDAIRQPMTVANIPITVSSSIGIALHQGAAISVDILINRADKALYRAKSAGRNGYSADLDLT
jgi:diguanylate cyclase (GGDEF)-like protein/PAS domain S-box-containing protein